MVDITAKLIWYRLGETFDKMAAGGNAVTSWLFSDWDDNLLDVLLFGWIGWAVLIVLIVNAVLTFFGPLQPRVARWEKKEGVSGAPVEDHTGAETSRWLNSGLNWFYIHYDSVPEFIELWVKSLNEQVVKLGGPVQLKFERVKPGSLPPKFHEVTFDAGSENKYVLNCKVDSKDLSFAIFASQQTSGGVKLTNLTASVLKLKGTICFKCSKVGSDMMLNAAFVGRPDVKISGKPVNPYQDPSDLVDIEVVEEVVRNAICLASTDINLTKWLTGSTLNLPRPDTSPAKKAGQHVSEAVFEPIQAEKQQSAFQAAPQSRSTRSGDKKLLIKIIKASGLGSKEGPSDPTCLIYMDTPAQTYTTSECRGTANPFWDEQFMFDVNQNTNQVKFEVIDRRKPSPENFLGEAIVYFDELKRNPSSRQIISLQGRPERGTDHVTGSITVELLVLDSSEAEAYSYSMPKNQTSPKRLIEVTQAKSPSGMLVTTTTTTTEKHNSRHEPGLNSSPNYVQKRQNYDYDVSNPSSLERTSPDSSLLPHDRSLSQSSGATYRIDGVDSVVETAIRELKNNKRKSRTPTKTTTLIITGVQRTSDPIEDDLIPSVVTHPPSPGQHDKAEKKKTSIAGRIRKRFSRSKKRSLSADRASSSVREGSNYLQPPEGSTSPRSKDDMELDRQQPETPNLKKSRSLGGSLKKLFRRSRKRSRGRDEMSRESSLSRSSAKNLSKGPSREASLTRTGHSPRESAIS